jgi:integrase
MRGHIRQRGTNWAVIIDHGRDENGKRKQKWHSGYKTKGEAERALTAFMAAKDNGERVPEAPARLRYGTFLRDQWLLYLEARVTHGTMRPSTAAFYRQLVLAHILPGLGAERLRSLDAGVLEAFYAELRGSGKKVRPGEPRAGLSQTTVHHVHVTVVASLKYAVRRKLLARNPASDVQDLPGPSKGQRPCWTAQETAEFLSAARGDRLYALYLLVATTGLRRGEVAGLSWEQVDLEAGTLTVARARVSIRGRVAHSEPKTAKARRTIAIAPVVVEALRSYRRHQREGHLALGPGWTDTGLVFTCEDGRGLHPDFILRSFQRAARCAGLPVISFHGLRHGAATAGLAAGVPLLAMSKRLGHSSVSITGDLYSHVVERLDREAAERTAALLVPATPR